jgi:hypothetical protein
VDRLQLGFGCDRGGSGGPSLSSGSFVQLAMKDVTVETWRLRKLPLQYGRCRQVISLRPSNAGKNCTDVSSSKQRQRNTILDFLRHEIVHQTKDDESPATRRKWVKTLPPVGSVIGDATSIATPNNGLVDHATTTFTASSSSFDAVPILSDDLAFELAKKHGATMVTTFDTLLVLLTTCISSKPPAMSWIIPVSRGETCHHQKDMDHSTIKINSNLIILESPTQLSYSSTREWMTTGVEEALNQILQEQSSSTTCNEQQDTTDSGNKSSSSTPCYTYTLLTLPSPARNKPCRVLVRQIDRFFCASGKCLLRAHVQLEYFPESGNREIPSILDKAVWMLDYVLQPLCRVVVAKVDPSSCRILEWNDVSLAHALTQPSSLPKPLLPMFDEDVNSSMDHLWQQLDHLLTMAIPTIGPGQHVLCYPARFGTTSTTQNPGNQPRHNSISVHQPLSSLGGGRKEDVLVDVSVEIPQSRAMNADKMKCLVEPDAVRRCYRPWQWPTTVENAESQIPFTFPAAVLVSNSSRNVAQGSIKRSLK